MIQLNLSESLLIYKDIKPPQIANNGYSLDVFSPFDMYLIPNSHIRINIGFGLNLPEGVLGFITPKAHLDIPFSMPSGLIIFPKDINELTAYLKYQGLSEVTIHKGDPLFQITLITSGGLFHE